MRGSHLRAVYIRYNAIGIFFLRDNMYLIVITRFDMGESGWRVGWRIWEFSKPLRKVKTPGRIRRHFWRIFFRNQILRVRIV